MRRTLLLLAVLCPFAAGAQSQLGGAGQSLPPPQPAAPSAPRPAAAAPAAQPAPARPAAPASAQPPRPTAPTAPRAAPPPGQPGTSRPPQGQPTQSRPQGQPTQARPGQAAPSRPGQAQQGQQRRPGAAGAGVAAGAAAGAAAAGAAAAAPPQPAPAPPPEPQPTVGSATGLPLPRFAALGGDVNLRVGPGRNFPVDWRYQRRDLPVMIVREHNEWRRIRDVDGTEGWVAASNLRPGRRTFLVRGPQAAEIPLRRRAEDNAAPVARLQPGVIGRVRACDAGSPWCEVQVQDHRGYLRRAEMFGVGADEEIK